MILSLLIEASHFQRETRTMTAGAQTVLFNIKELGGMGAAMIPT